MVGPHKVSWTRLVLVLHKSPSPGGREGRSQSHSRKHYRVAFSLCDFVNEPGHETRRGGGGGGGGRRPQWETRHFHSYGTVRVAGAGHVEGGRPGLASFPSVLLLRGPGEQRLAELLAIGATPLKTEGTRVPCVCYETK